MIIVIIINDHYYHYYLSIVHTMPLSKFAGHSSVFKIYHFQSLPAKKMCRFHVNGKAYTSHFSVTSKCAGIV